MIGLAFDALLISCIARFFFLKENDASFVEALIPAAIISIVNLVLVLLLLPILGILAIPVIVAADGLVLSWAYGLYLKEAALFASAIFVCKLGLHLMLT